MREQWRPAYGHEGYEVSDQGRIRRIKTGRIQAARPWRKANQTGLQRMATFGKHGGREWVSRVVLKSFVGPPPAGTEASHLNGDSLDDRLENLAWETHSVNQLRKREHGTMTRGEAVNTAKLTEDQVRQLRALRRAGVTGTELARRFGIANSSAYQIINRKSWAHVA